VRFFGLDQVDSAQSAVSCPLLSHGARQLVQGE